MACRRLAESGHGPASELPSRRDPLREALFAAALLPSTCTKAQATNAPRRREDR